jgi:hypothetical protein
MTNTDEILDEVKRLKPDPPRSKLDDYADLQAPIFKSHPFYSVNRMNTGFARIWTVNHFWASLAQIGHFFTRKWLP